MAGDDMVKGSAFCCCRRKKIREHLFASIDSDNTVWYSYMDPPRFIWYFSSMEWACSSRSTAFRRIKKQYSFLLHGRVRDCNRRTSGLTSIDRVPSANIELELMPTLIMYLGNHAFIDNRRNFRIGEYRWCGEPKSLRAVSSWESNNSGDIDPLKSQLRRVAPRAEVTSKLVSAGVLFVRLKCIRTSAYL